MKKIILLIFLFSSSSLAHSQCNFAKQSEVDITCKTLQSLLRQHIKNDEKQQIWVLLKTYQDINTLCNVPDTVKNYVNNFMKANKILYEEIAVNRSVALTHTSTGKFRSAKPQVITLENSMTTQ